MQHCYLPGLPCRDHGQLRRREVSLEDGQEIFLCLFFFISFLGQEIFYIYSFFIFILGQEISSGALFALRRSHGCRFGRESWLSQVHRQRGGLQVNIAVLKKKIGKKL